MPAWIPYTLLRVALFGVTFAVVYGLLGNYPLPFMVAPLIAAVAATLVSLSVTYIFFSRLRDRVSAEFAASRERSRRREEGVATVDDRGEDELVEDTVVEETATEQRGEERG